MRPIIVSTLTVNHSIISGNTRNGSLSPFGGGGIGAISITTLTVNHSIISGNSADGGGCGGILISATQAEIDHSIISGNTGTTPVDLAFAVGGRRT